MNPLDAKDLLLKIAGFELLDETEEYPAVIIRVCTQSMNLDVSVSMMA